MKMKSASSWIVLLGVLAGCGKETATEPSARLDGENGEARKIVVGVTNVFPGVSFVDDNGQLTGFDIELAKELDRRLPEYEFEFVPQPFGNLLLGLETGKIDFVAQLMNRNPEREAKYLFSAEPYSYFMTKVAVGLDNDTIRSIDDLRGRKLYLGSSTSNNAYYIEDYNNRQERKIEVMYGNGAAHDLVELIRTKRIDATLQTDFSVRFETDEEGNQALKLVGEPLFEGGVHYVLRQGEDELAAKLDEAVRAAKADGTIAKLNIEWLGQDFTKSLKELGK
mgnify:CR=1 FL=1|jgi:L-cystine transport system substrate-binding protein